MLAEERCIVIGAGRPSGEPTVTVAMEMHMELSEAFVRIVGRHLVLIALLVGCGLLGGGLLHSGDPTEYSATVRLALGTGDPSNQAESTVVGDTVRALATSPGLVGDALHSVGANRDPVTTAQQHVDATVLGSSGVVSLAVSDSDAAVAIALANVIGQAVVSAHEDMIHGRDAATLDRVQTDIAQAERSIASLDGHIKAVGPLYEVVVPKGGVPLSERPWAEPNQLLRQRADLVRGLLPLYSERASMEAARALHAQDTVVDRAAAPAERVPGQLVPYLALGGLLGLVLGIGLAATLETFRPTLVGRNAIARSLGAPVLADLSGDALNEAGIAEAAIHIELAAAGAHVHRVALLAPSRQYDLQPLTDRLALSVIGVTLHVIGQTDSLGPVAESSSVPQAAGHAEAWPPAADGATGVVLVTPKAVRLAELTRTVEFFTISGWPLIGVIVVPALRVRGYPRIRRDAAAPTDAPTPLDAVSR